jgi:hemoglobin-like flavoprotein
MGAHSGAALPAETASSAPFSLAHALLLSIQDRRGPMNREDITRVQATWHAIEPVKRVAAELFYVKLFELDSTLKLLFGNQQAREQKFLQLMDATVNGLEHSDVMVAAVRELGIRHPLFGDSDERHGSVGVALFWSLQKCLRKEFTAEVHAAWTNTYELLSKAIRTVPWAETEAA